MNVYRKLVAIFGSQTELARQLGVTRSCVNKWVHRQRIPPHYVIRIEKASEGQITRWEMRPDLYPVDRVKAA